MTRFLDGPAQGVTLFLHRAPVFLRAVQELEGEPTWMHVNRRVNGRNVSGCYRGGQYREGF